MLYDYGISRLLLLFLVTVSLYKQLREFGIRGIRYITYRVAVGGDIAIRFLSNLSQKTSSFIPNSCKQFAKDLLLYQILLTTKRLLAKSGIVIGLLQGGCYMALAD